MDDIDRDQCEYMTEDDTDELGDECEEEWSGAEYEDYGRVRLSPIDNNPYDSEYGGSGSDECSNGGTDSDTDRSDTEGSAEDESSEEEECSEKDEEEGEHTDEEDDEEEDRDDTEGSEDGNEDEEDEDC